MKKVLFTIESNAEVASRVFRMRLSGDTSAILRAGQFANFEIEGKFLRRPFAVREWDSEGFDVYYKVVGEGTAILSGMKPGHALDVLTGLGNGFDVSACKRKALVVCGGLGSSPAFSLVRNLVADGKEVTLILGFNTVDDVVLRGEYESLGVDLHIVTLDGSLGEKGLVTDVISRLDPSYDYFYTCGPAVMMKAVCEALPGPGEASLEERMGCGCGICFGCTCHTVSGPKRVCSDGPVFKKEEIIW